MKATYVSSWGLEDTTQNTPEMQLARRVAKLGWKVNCITYSRDAPERASTEAIGIERFQPWVGRLPKTVAVYPRLRRMSRIVRRVLSTRNDVWHLHHPSSLVIATSLSLLRRRDSPVVFTSHDPLVAAGKRAVISAGSAFEGLRATPFSRIPEVVLRSLPYHIADKIIALTDFERRMLVRCGIPTGRITVIPHGVRPLPRTTGIRAKLNLPDKPLVLVVGRFVAQKGHKYLLQAIPTIVKNAGAHFLLVGRQPVLLRELETMANQLSVRRHITFVSDMSEDDLFSAYNDCDIVVLPSLYESFGIAILEAMAAGKPVVASDVGGVSEIVDKNRTGILVPPADAQSLAEAIQDLLRSATRRESLGRAGLAKVEEDYRWSTIARRTVEIYNEAKA